MENLLRDIINDFRSSVFRDYYLEHLPSWNYWQMVKVIMTYVTSRYHAATLLDRYSGMLSNPDEIRLCHMLAEDYRLSGSIGIETKEFSIRIPFRNLDIPFIDYSCLVNLGEPKLFSRFDVVQYWPTGEKSPRKGLLVDFHDGFRMLSSYYCIYDLQNMVFPSDDLCFKPKTDIALPFNVDRFCESDLDTKSLRNLRLCLDKINESENGISIKRDLDHGNA